MKCLCLTTENGVNKSSRDKKRSALEYTATELFLRSANFLYSELPGFKGEPFPSDWATLRATGRRYRRLLV